jgi:hypothetical protein
MGAEPPVGAHSDTSWGDDILSAVFNAASSKIYY